MMICLDIMMVIIMVVQFLFYLSYMKLRNLLNHIGILFFESYQLLECRVYGEMMRFKQFKTKYL